MLKDVLFKNKKKFNLQLFAEPATEPATEPQTEPNAEPAVKKEPENKPTKPEKKYDDDDLNRIIKQKKADWDKQQAEKERVAKMDADQKAQYELEQERKEKAELQERLDRYELSKTATSLLRENDIDATDDVLSFVVGTDEAATTANVKKLASIIEAQVKKAEKARATGVTPKNYTTSNTVSEIDKRIAKYEK